MDNLVMILIQTLTVTCLKTYLMILLSFSQNVVEFLVAISFRFAGLSILIKHVYRDIYTERNNRSVKR